MRSFIPASTTLKVLAWPRFFEQHFGNEKASIAHHVASGFDDDFQSKLTQGRDDGACVSSNREWRSKFVFVFPPAWISAIERPLVDDPDAASDAEELDPVMFLQFCREGSNFVDCLDEGSDGSQLRADVHLETDQFDMSELLRSGGVDFFDDVEIDAEFVFTFSGGNIFVRFGVDVRVHPQGDRRDFPLFFGNFVDVVEFCFGLDVERVDPLLQSVGDFVFGFADAGESAHCRIASARDDPEEFPARDDVEAAPLFGQKIENRKVGVCFDGIADHVIELSKSAIEAREVIGDRGLTVNVKGRAVFFSR